MEAPCWTPLVCGTVEQVRFQAPTGFAVLGVFDDHSQQLQTVVGNAPPACRGMTLEAWGAFVDHTTFGPQCQAEHIVLRWPKTGAGIEQCLVSGFLPGVGPELGKRIYDRFGERFPQVVRDQPERLCEVHGVGRARMKKIVHAWCESEQMYTAIGWLGQYGVVGRRAARVWNEYREKTVEVVTQTPYRVCAEIKGLGFDTMDQVALKLGVARDNPERVTAGLNYLLEETAQMRGHCAVPRSQLEQDAIRLLGVPQACVQQGLDAAVRPGQSGRTLVQDQIAGRAWVQLANLFWAEACVAEQVRDRLLDEPDWDIAAARRHLVAAEEAREVTLSPSQRQAAEVLVSSAVAVLTGGPGTGKTTVLNVIVEALEQAGVTVAMAAPTGRAAQRMSQATGGEACTIHRLLGFVPGQGFTVNREAPLEADLVIVDEASMLEIKLARALVEALAPATALWFVGDPDQLPPVGPGDLLRDLLATEVVPAVRLTEVFRQARESGIVTNAHRINHGEKILSAAQTVKQDFWCVSPQNEKPEAMQRELVDLVGRRLPQYLGVDPKRATQVLTSVHRGPLGVAELNDALQDALNPATDRKTALYRKGDRVLQLRNDYPRELMNGEQGEVLEVFDDGECIIDWGKTRQTRHTSQELADTQLGYAMTVHKSQGSEFPVVVVVTHPSHGTFLDRSLLYTAVTRARDFVVVYGRPEWVRDVIGRRQSRQRWTRLQERILGKERPVPAAVIDPVST